MCIRKKQITSSGHRVFLNPQEIKTGQEDATHFIYCETQSNAHILFRAQYYQFAYLTGRFSSVLVMDSIIISFITTGDKA